MTAQCRICPRRCRLEEGQTGFCRARTNVAGKVVQSGYGRLCAIALDPIEKKPLARFHPGSRILSVGGFGCNLRCPFCQNSDISMADSSAPSRSYTPRELVDAALSLKDRGNIGIAYTYNEPLVGFEFLYDCARLAKEEGLLNVVVSNGMICERPLLELLDYIDAANFDLKGFTQDFYDLVGGELETVKRTIELASRRCHVEVTTLIIPGLNDSDGQMRREAEYLASLGGDIPLHISRFFPRYRMLDRPPTPVETIYRLKAVAQESLKYVYAGNC